ncbi:MAG: transposase [Desulfatiglandales bacterium]
MARAKRHYIPGHIWHLTHRCHKKEFLLKLVKDRRRWLQWLYQARIRYGMVILNYTVTSNHIHLLVYDEEGKNTIPQSVKLVAGRTAQEYNLRKNRKGAFWEDRYHATAVESGEHLLKCLVYIDLNMVRAGVVSHPADWPFGGYNEIRKPRRKYVLIDYHKLAGLAGFESYQFFLETHKEMVDERLTNGDNQRRSQWTESLGVGSKSFIETIRKKMGVKAKGRKLLEDGRNFCLREDLKSYDADFDGRNEDMGPQNTYYWDINLSISVG